MSLVVIGSVAYDDVETPFGKRERILGGSASYFSVTASHFTDVRLVAVVGSDFRDEDIETLRAHGVGLEGLQRADGPTFSWGGRYHENMNIRDTLFTELGVFADFRPELPEAHRDSEFVFLGNIHPSLQLDVLDQVRAPKFVAADTMNFWIDGELETVKKLLGRLDGLTINDEEAQLLSGEHNLVKAAKAVRAMGPSWLVIKRGEHGALLFTGERVFAVPAYPLEEVFDPTGAGDTFAGGFMGNLARAGEVTERNVRRSMVMGSVMASFCVEDFSLDRLTAVEDAEIAARYDAFIELSCCEAVGR